LKIAKDPASGTSNGSAIYGLSETKMFSGPDALRRALRYAMQKYRRVKPGHSARQGRYVGLLSPTGRC
jgi:hypothetical protein